MNEMERGAVAVSEAMQRYEIWETGAIGAAIPERFVA
jgi:hypothetical protein